jgi:hypothetical protein
VRLTLLNRSASSDRNGLSTYRDNSWLASLGTKADGSASGETQAQCLISCKHGADLAVSWPSPEVAGPESY